MRIQGNTCRHIFLSCKCDSFITLPSVIFHLLQFFRGECCQLGTSLLQSTKLYWTQDCGFGLRTKTQINPVNVLNTFYIVFSQVFHYIINTPAHTYTKQIKDTIIKWIDVLRFVCVCIARGKVESQVSLGLGLHHFLL